MRLTCSAILLVGRLARYWLLAGWLCRLVAVSSQVFVCSVFVRVCRLVVDFDAICRPHIALAVVTGFRGSLRG